MTLIANFIITTLIDVAAECVFLIDKTGQFRGGSKPFGIHFK